MELRFRRSPQPLSARQRKLLAREARREERAQQPSAASQALRRALAWKAEIDSTATSRADISRREGITRARVTQLLSLTDLPPEQQAQVLGQEGQYAMMSVRAALRLAARPAGSPAPDD